ncbi:prolipoprotein diacylglyceryl transferase [Candidatus Woesebacteria bacterium]|nr:prolipoprotein diacylglyceryl transferase [Candidatus Woesebacteria bacterium]
MFPILFTIGTVSLYSTSLMTVLAWLVFSFLFWRGLRAQGATEDHIFDLTFYATIVAFVAARAGYIVTHWDVFAGKSSLLMLALWVAPGLSWLSGLVGGLATLVFLSRQQKIRLGHVLDTLPIALGLPIIIGKLGSLLDGAEIGKQTTLIWGVRLAGHIGLRHPVQLYEMFAIGIIGICMLRIVRRAMSQKWPYGIVGVWFILLYSVVMFALEFFKDSRVYLGNITANQWMLIGIFAESVGVLYVRGGGKERIRFLLRFMHTKLGQIGKNIYAKLSRRSLSGDQKSS